jgi:dethiobiotin synthetase
MSAAGAAAPGVDPTGAVLVVTGTGTGVGKTVVTAAIAALAVAAGCRVAVLKPAQTGVGPGERGDLDDVARLVGDRVTLRELARYPDPLAPDTAARRAGTVPVAPADVVAATRELAVGHDLVLVEGSGGLLVRLDATGGTLADVAGILGVPVLVVAAAGLGTLNHTALTIEALRSRGLRCPGIVLGAWPAVPDLAARCNFLDLPTVTGVPLLGALPEGAGTLAPAGFLALARRGVGVELGGVWDGLRSTRDVDPERVTLGSTWHEWLHLW